MIGGEYRASVVRMIRAARDYVGLNLIHFQMFDATNSRKPLMPSSHVVAPQPA